MLYVGVLSRTLSPQHECMNTHSAVGYLHMLRRRLTMSLKCVVQFGAHAGLGRDLISVSSGYNCASSLKSL